MPVNIQQYQAITHALAGKATLVAVSKTKPAGDILELYAAGQRDFGENYVQELADKQASLPADINWHFIGHLQSNKVKQIAGFVHLIHGVDSLKLLQEINKQAAHVNRIIPVLLQVYIAREETKFGLDEEELDSILQPASGVLASLQHVAISGLMGMASFTTDSEVVAKEFAYLHGLFVQYGRLPWAPGQFKWLSMGMSGDYALAVANGSNMVRIGSLLFGERAAKR